MSSFGMELEICCWEPSHDILSQNEYPEVPSVSPEIVKLLESSDDCAPTSLDAPLIYPRPIAVYQEDLHLANFGLLDSGTLEISSFANFLQGGCFPLRPFAILPRLLAFFPHLLVSIQSLPAKHKCPLPPQYVTLTQPSPLRQTTHKLLSLCRASRRRFLTIAKQRTR